MTLSRETEMLVARALTLGAARADRQKSAQELVNICAGRRELMESARDRLGARLHAYSADHEATKALQLVYTALPNMDWHATVAPNRSRPGDIVTRGGGRMGQLRAHIGAVSSVAIGLSVTLMGAFLLYSAHRNGSSLQDMGIEIGAAVALSGVLWWCSVRVRNEPLRGKLDISAIVLPGILGASAILWALAKGGRGADAQLTLGAGLGTLLVFCALENQYLLKSGDDLPLWHRILGMPFTPFVWWVFRDFDVDVFEGPRVSDPLDAVSLMREREMEASFAVFDGDNPYRDPEYFRETFSPSPAQVADALGVVLSEGFTNWVSAAQGRYFEWMGSESIVRSWPWSAIRHHPIDTDEALVFFADETGPDGQCHIALDLRAGPKSGSLIRCHLVGSRPTWSIIGSEETIAASFNQWQQCLTPLS